MLSIHFIVYGSVQGVGFRKNVQSIAKKLYICGYIRNLSNGSVECIAQGSKENIDSFLHQIKDRFTIQDIQINWDSKSKSFSGFSIL